MNTIGKTQFLLLSSSQYMNASAEIIIIQKDAPFLVCWDTPVNF